MRKKQVSHKEHGKLGNPNPDKSGLILYQAVGSYNEPLSKKGYFIVLPVSDTEYLDSLPRDERILLMRGAIIEEIKERKAIAL